MTGWTAPEGAEPVPPSPSPETATGPAYGAPPGPSYGSPYGGGYGYGWPPPPPATARPGIIPLRPIGLGEVLDGSFAAIRTAPIATLGIAAMFMLVNQAVLLGLNYSLLHVTTTTTSDGTTVTDTADAVARVGATYIATAVLTSILLLALTGVMAIVAGERVVGRRATMKVMRARLRPVAWPLVRVVVLVTAIVAGSVAVALAPGILVSAAGSGGGGAALLAVGFFLLAVPVIYCWTTFSLAPAVVVLERQGARAALRRSRRLVHRAWWRVFGISALAWLIAAVVGAVLAVPFAFAGGGLNRIFAGQTNNLSFLALLMNALGGFVGGTLARPFQAGVSALLYIDCRMRSEGLDLALQQAASSDPAGATATTS